MASVALVTRNVVLDRGPDAARASSLSLAQTATVTCDNNGVAAVGGTDTITIDVGAAISAAKRNGKTVTLRAVALSRPLTTQTTAGVEVTHAGYLTFSGNVVTVVPKSDGWLTGSTNSTISATAPVVEPYAITCVYTEA